ncbi:MAG: LuxR C-terminal-related transcriptional regulator [Bacteroidetes bacterium]|nr:LuxR C-terminal-related transcriptional regulator [Bacteroidota bacterium]
MTDSVNIFISIINLFSLLIGGSAIAIIFKFARTNSSAYLNYYFLFLIFGVISGFCDWIVFNWVLLLVPGMSPAAADWVYHIFWDLIGFPSALISVYFLIRTINHMLDINYSSLNKWITVSLVMVIVMLSYTSLYFRLQETESILSSFLWMIFFYLLPLVQLSYLAFTYYRSIKLRNKNSPVGKFILILFFTFFFWYLLSLAPIKFGLWRHLIIFTYYLALFLPTIYLYFFFNSRNSESNPIISNIADPEDVFVQYKFTNREKELVLLLLAGKSNKEISDGLYISIQTVKNYISKIYKRLGIKNRVELVNLIHRNRGSSE